MTDPNGSPIEAQSHALRVDDLKWYSGLALQAMIAKQGIPETESAREEVALWAHRMGEAMVRTAHRLNRAVKERE
jgi:hypothetical protein